MHLELHHQLHQFLGNRLPRPVDQRLQPALLAVLTGVTGVFLARDLLLFYFFWELMLVPMYFLIGIWGHERRVYAAVQFLLFTFISSLLMLGAILALVFAHFRATSVLTFDSAALLCTPLAPAVETWLMLGFFVAFATKLAAVTARRTRLAAPSAPGPADGTASRRLPRERVGRPLASG